MEPPSLRIASYNLQKCVGLDLRRRPERILQVIGHIGAEITVLQEADKRLPPRPAALPHAMVEDEGWRVVDFGEHGASLGWHGNAMLLRDSVQVIETAHVDLPGLEPRGAIRADVQTSIGPLRVIGVHLGLIRRYRVMQIAAVERHLRELPPMPTVLAGDCNEWGSLRALDTMAQSLRFLPSKPSFPALRPVAALDRFGLSDDLTAKDQGVHRVRPAHIASDHLPVWVDLQRG
ncbi:endonuclease [Litorivita pollutaquae]|uniref:Endonuclease n=1 Tax=Litorivita pollutaquae TaxID=2200892 RepID=A0A2V4NGW2_9RHOB|nr:endonuclease/exonuclease/phosphatase family protein [Litorivita pollutaquae]OUS20947.1 endonuclease [Rhodobacterales bacterium 59_46_T64]PYC49350.1 endonuclease [Litorivita pollutaquae]